MVADNLNWTIADFIYICGKYEVRYPQTNQTSNAVNLNINRPIKYILSTIILINMINYADHLF